jgi:hypothetical protein
MKNYQEAKASDEVIKSILDMKPVEKDRSNLTTPQTLETLAFN